MASRVGDDDLGREACRVMEDLGLSAAYVQCDRQRPTGTAGVFIDSAGQPTFTIKESVSWDFLQWTDSWEGLSARADVVCFGTLAQRSPASAATIERFLQNTRKEALRIFDVNLRQSLYSAKLLRRSLQHSDIVKLNDQELLHVSSLLGLNSGDEETLARRLLTHCGLRLVCVTRAARGSLLVSQDRTVQHEGLNVRVADAVGAGDAFAACLAHHYVRGKPLEEISESANRFASWVATQVGATPMIHRSRLRSILGEIAPD